MSWVTDAVRLFGVFAADHEKRTAQLYELLSTHNTLGESSSYQNAGYWDGATRYDDACQRLAEVLGEAADLHPGCAVLECGFGFGDAALFWNRRFDPATIDGLNITRSQVEKARERVRAAGLDQRVRLHLGSATRMPFADAGFDRVVALETAFHFDTREAFFREAFRVLKPGGRLATADMLPVEGPQKRWWQTRLDGSWHIPPANRHSRSGYIRRLAEAGFTGVRLESVGHMVYVPFREFARARLRAPEIRARMNPLVRWLLGAMFHSMRPNEIDYVIAVADKP